MHSTTPPSTPAVKMNAHDEALKVIVKGLMESPGTWMDITADLAPVRAMRPEALRSALLESMRSYCPHTRNAEGFQAESDGKIWKARYTNAQTRMEEAEDE